MARDWTIADRISDQITDVANKELDAMRKENRIDPWQVLVGYLLAFCALEKTMPEETKRPTTLRILINAVKLCLLDVMENKNEN